MAFENYEDIRANDVIEIFEREEVKRTLTNASSRDRKKGGGNAAPFCLRTVVLTGGVTG